MLLFFAACLTKPTIPDGGAAGPDSGGADSGAGTLDGGALDGGMTAGDGGGSGGDGGGTTPAPPSIVRFVALGDAGEGNTDQYLVAEQIRRVCQEKDDEHGPGCAFVLYLGDNFYDDGVDDVDDDQWQDKFELPYANLDLPFMVALGNHDYGLLSVWWWKADVQVEYTDLSDKWTLPDKYYRFDWGHARFYGLNTNEILLGWSDAEQLSWLDAERAASTATWNIAFGHHPYKSNGQHGNAGAYEGYEWLPIANGATVKSFMESGICSRMDLYLSGHDHNRQWLEPECGVELIVSGAGSKTTDLVGRGSPTLFEDDSVEGFVWIELRDRTLTGEFWTRDGEMDFSRSISR